jgi:FMN-dependent NADH-azoreductase
MPTLLHIDSSADLASSRTRLLTAAFAEAWRSRRDDRVVVRRDLHLDPLPHLRTPAQHWPARLRDGDEVPAELDALQQTILDELCSADVVVIGAPMYNYAVPSTLKAWIDLIHVPGVMAHFDVESQPMKGRPAVIATARGGIDTAEERTLISAPLSIALAGGLGMEVTVVSTSRTLAGRVPALDAEQAGRELEAARRQIIELAGAL